MLDYEKYFFSLFRVILINLLACEKEMWKEGKLNLTDGSLKQSHLIGPGSFLTQTSGVLNDTTKPYWG